MTPEQKDKYQRLDDRLAELNNLNGNIGRLRFYLDENVDELDGDALNEMVGQFNAMMVYRNKLECRIEKGWY